MSLLFALFTFAKHRRNLGKQRCADNHNNTDKTHISEFLVKHGIGQNECACGVNIAE